VSLETVTFDDRGDRTLMRTHAVYQSVDARDAMVESGMEEGLNAGLAALDELLETLVGQN
jgi:uncharacterized protein YndB with AHSA1/START domain